MALIGTDDDREYPFQSGASEVSYKSLRTESPRTPPSRPPIQPLPEGVLGGGPHEDGKRCLRMEIFLEQCCPIWNAIFFLAFGGTLLYLSIDKTYDLSDYYTKAMCQTCYDEAVEYSDKYFEFSICHEKYDDWDDNCPDNLRHSHEFGDIISIDKKYYTYGIFAMVVAVIAVPFILWMRRQQKLRKATDLHILIMHSPFTFTEYYCLIKILQYGQKNKYENCYVSSIANAGETILRIGLYGAFGYLVVFLVLWLWNCCRSCSEVSDISEENNDPLAQPMDITSRWQKAFSLFSTLGGILWVIYTLGLLVLVIIVAVPGAWVAKGMIIGGVCLLLNALLNPYAWRFLIGLYSVYIACLCRKCKTN